jgi:hypothetical protein
MFIRSNFLKTERNNLLKHNINAHLLDQAIARCVAMYKSASSNEAIRKKIIC